MEKYGVFISYRHEDWALAGRIYDYLEVRGFQPFLDTNSLRQGNFHDALGYHITQAPYFLCLLTKHTFQTISADDWIFKEIKTALSSDSEILLLAEKGFEFPKDLPPEIDPIRFHQCYDFDLSDFLDKMDRLCKKDLKRERLEGILDWRKSLSANSNTCMSARKLVERDHASLEDRFGKEFVDCVRSGSKFTGINRIRSIHISCYAASIIFSPGVNMVDEQAFDRGMMFNIFAQLLDDDDFSLEIVISAPGSFATQDAINYDKLGNSSLEANPEAVFLSSYCNIQRLIAEDAVFRKAYQDKRFRIMVTEESLPYAIFQVTYKDEFSEYDHIKVDLYSEGLVSSMDRRCMVIFRENDQDNYSFFMERYNFIRNVKESRRLIKANHSQWLKDWELLQEEL